MAFPWPRRLLYWLLLILLREYPSHKSQCTKFLLNFLYSPTYSIPFLSLGSFSVCISLLNSPNMILPILWDLSPLWSLLNFHNQILASIYSLHCKINSEHYFVVGVGQSGGDGCECILGKWNKAWTKSWIPTSSWHIENLSFVHDLLLEINWWRGGIRLIGDDTGKVNKSQIMAFYNYLLKEEWTMKDLV